MTKDEKDLVKRAHKLFATCNEEESENRRLWREDLRFANGDSDNGWQWDAQLAKSRATSRKVHATSAS
jgi:hypothetical protein